MGPSVRLGFAALLLLACPCACKSSPTKKMEAVRDFMADDRLRTGEPLYAYPICDRQAPTTAPFPLETPCVRALVRDFGGTELLANAPDAPSLVAMAVLIGRDMKVALVSREPWLTAMRRATGAAADSLRLAVTQALSIDNSLSCIWATEACARSVMQYAARAIPGACPLYATLGAGGDVAAAKADACVQRDIEQSGVPGSTQGDVFRAAEGAAAAMCECVHALREGVAITGARARPYVDRWLARVEEIAAVQVGCAPTTRALARPAPNVEKGRGYMAPPVFASARLMAGALLPNGHVLIVPAKRGRVLDWHVGSEAPPREIVIADDVVEDSGAPTPEPRVEPVYGSARFVVVHPGDDPQRPARLVLWDAERMLKIRELDRPARAPSSAQLAVSRDGRRFAYSTCAGGAAGDLQCDVDTFSAQDGERAGRTSFPRLEVQGYVPALSLSPDGRFVALESPLAGKEVRDVASGALVFQERDAQWGGLDRGPRQLVWLDAARVFSTSRFGGRTSVTDVASSSPPATRVRMLDLTLAKDEHAQAPRLSPGAGRAAVVVERVSGAELTVWTIADGTSLTKPIPRAVCVGDCEVAWTNDHVVIAYADEPAPRSSLRVDVATSTETVVPYERAPAFVRDSFQVFADLAASSAEPVAFAAPRQRLAGTPGADAGVSRAPDTLPPWVDTPSWRVELGPHDGVELEVRDGKLLVMALGRRGWARVITAPGASFPLVARSPE